MNKGQLVTSRDSRDDPQEILVVLEANVEHASGLVALVAPAGFEEERRFRQQRLLEPWSPINVDGLPGYEDDEDVQYVDGEWVPRAN
jgi:hypothetical protein